MHRHRVYLVTEGLDVVCEPICSRAVGGNVRLSHEQVILITDDVTALEIGARPATGRSERLYGRHDHMMGFGIRHDERRDDLPQRENLFTPIGSSDIHFQIMLADGIDRVSWIKQGSPGLRLSKVQPLFLTVGPRAMDLDTIGFIERRKAIQLLCRFLPALRHCLGDVQRLVTTRLQRGLHFFVVVVQCWIERRQGKPLCAADDRGTQFAEIGIGTESFSLTHSLPPRG